MASQKLFPPTLDGALPAFCKTYDSNRHLEGATINVPFTLGRIVSPNEVDGFRIRISTTSSNTLVLIGDTEYHREDDQYVASFKFGSDDAALLNEGQYYRVQLAFLDKEKNPSYYSTVGIIKCVAKPTCSLLQMDIGEVNTFQTDIVGVYEQDTYFGDSTEKAYQYRFILYNSNDEIIVDSDWILHDATQDTSSDTSRDIFRIYTELDEGEIGTLIYRVITLNGLEISSLPYKIMKIRSVDLEYPLELYTTNNYDNGCIELTLHGVYNHGLIDESDKTNTGEEAVYSGMFVIQRSDEYSDYKEWCDIARFVIAGDYASHFGFRDFTVVQGVNYQYSIQQYNSNRVYSERVFSFDITPWQSYSDPMVRAKKAGITPVKADFEDMFLFDGTRQLKIKYNPRVSSFKQTVQEQKQDTIGSKYPFIFRNAHTSYKEFPIGGLISFTADDCGLFLTDEELLQSHILENDYVRIGSAPYGAIFDNDKRIAYTNVDLKSYIEQNYWINVITDINPITGAVSTEKVYTRYPEKDIQTKKTYKGIVYFDPIINDLPEARGKQREDLFLYGIDSNTIPRTVEGLIRTDRSLTTDNVTAERYYKIKVLEWLSDGQVKLFKSPTEGNYLVRLLNTQATPQENLGRMLYAFSTQAYEIDDLTYEKLVYYHIVTNTTPLITATLWKSIDLKKILLEQPNKSDTWYTIPIGKHIPLMLYFDDFMPGDKIEITFQEESDPSYYLIGRTGNLTIDSENRTIIKLRIQKAFIVNNYVYTNNPMEYSRTLTYSYLGLATSKFDSIFKIKTKVPIAEQFIGPKTDLLMPYMVSALDKKEKLINCMDTIQSNLNIVKAWLDIYPEDKNNIDNLQHLINLIGNRSSISYSDGPNPIDLILQDLDKFLNPRILSKWDKIIVNYESLEQLQSELITNKDIIIGSVCYFDTGPILDIVNSQNSNNMTIDHLKQIFEIIVDIPITLYYNQTTNKEPKIFTPFSSLINNLKFVDNYNNLLKSIFNDEIKITEEIVITNNRNNTIPEENINDNIPDLLRKIAIKWQDISRENRKKLAKTLSNATYQNTFISIMENYNFFLTRINDIEEDNIDENWAQQEETHYYVSGEIKDLQQRIYKTLMDRNKMNYQLTDYADKFKVLTLEVLKARKRPLIPIFACENLMWSEERDQNNKLIYQGFRLTESTKFAVTPFNVGYVNNQVIYKIKIENGIPTVYMHNEESLKTDRVDYQLNKEPIDILPIEIPISSIQEIAESYNSNDTDLDHLNYAIFQVYLPNIELTKEGTEIIAAQPKTIQTSYQDIFYYQQSQLDGWIASTGYYDLYTSSWWNPLGQELNIDNENINSNFIIYDPSFCLTNMPIAGEPKKHNNELSSTSLVMRHPDGTVDNFAPPTDADETGAEEIEKQNIELGKRIDTFQTKMNFINLNEIEELEMRNVVAPDCIIIGSGTELELTPKLQIIDYTVEEQLNDCWEFKQRYLSLKDKLNDELIYSYKDIEDSNEKIALYRYYEGKKISAENAIEMINRNIDETQKLADNLISLMNTLVLDIYQYQNKELNSIFKRIICTEVPLYLDRNDIFAFYNNNKIALPQDVGDEHNNNIGNYYFYNYLKMSPPNNPPELIKEYQFEDNDYYNRLYLYNAKDKKFMIQNEEGAYVEANDINIDTETWQRKIDDKNAITILCEDDINYNDMLQILKYAYTQTPTSVTIRTHKNVLLGTLMQMYYDRIGHLPDYIETYGNYRNWLQICINNRLGHLYALLHHNLCAVSTLDQINLIKTDNNNDFLLDNYYYDSTENSIRENKIYFNDNTNNIFLYYYTQNSPYRQPIKEAYLNQKEYFGYDNDNNEFQNQICLYSQDFIAEDIWQWQNLNFYNKLIEEIKKLLTDEQKESFNNNQNSITKCKIYTDNYFKTLITNNINSTNNYQIILTDNGILRNSAELQNILDGKYFSNFETTDPEYEISQKWKTWDQYVIINENNEVTKSALGEDISGGLSPQSIISQAFNNAIQPLSQKYQDYACNKTLTTQRMKAQKHNEYFAKLEAFDQSHQNSDIKALNDLSSKELEIIQELRDFFPNLDELTPEQRKKVDSANHPKEIIDEKTNEKKQYYQDEGVTNIWEISISVMRDYYIEYFWDNGFYKILILTNIGRTKLSEIMSQIDKNIQDYYEIADILNNRPEDMTDDEYNQLRTRYQTLSRNLIQNQNIQEDINAYYTSYFKYANRLSLVDSESSGSNTELNQLNNTDYNNLYKRILSVLNLDFFTTQYGALYESSYDQNNTKPVTTTKYEKDYYCDNYGIFRFHDDVLITLEETQGAAASSIFYVENPVDATKNLWNSFEGLLVDDVDYLNSESESQIFINIPENITSNSVEYYYYQALIKDAEARNSNNLKYYSKNYVAHQYYEALTVGKHLTELKGIYLDWATRSTVLSKIDQIERNILTLQHQSQKLREEMRAAVIVLKTELMLGKNYRTILDGEHQDELNKLLDIIINAIVTIGIGKYEFCNFCQLPTSPEENYYQQITEVLLYQHDDQDPNVQVFLYSNPDIFDKEEEYILAIEELFDKNRNLTNRDGIFVFRDLTYTDWQNLPSDIQNSYMNILPADDKYLLQQLLQNIIDNEENNKNKVIKYQLRKAEKELMDGTEGNQIYASILTRRDNYLKELEKQKQIMAEKLNNYKLAWKNYKEKVQEYSDLLWSTNPEQEGLFVLLQKYKETLSYFDDQNFANSDIRAKIIYYIRTLKYINTLMKNLNMPISDNELINDDAVDQNIKYQESFDSYELYYKLLTDLSIFQNQYKEQIKQYQKQIIEQQIQQTQLGTWKDPTTEHVDVDKALSEIKEALAWYLAALGYRYHHEVEELYQK